MSRDRGQHLSAALSATELIVTRRHAGRADVSRVALDAGPGDHGTWPELAAALRALAQAEGGGEIALALLPPLIDVSRLELPPLDDADLIQLLSRNAGRYFVAARGAQVVGVTQQRGRRGGPSIVVAATAATRVVAAIDAAARETGWSVTAVTPAEAAWAAAAVAIWPAFARDGAQVLVHDSERTMLLELHGGRLAGVRRFRAGAADAELIADAIAATDGARASAIGAFGVQASRQELSRALSARGISARPATGPWSEYSGTPVLLAAAFAAESSGPLLLNEQARAARRAQARRATLAVAVAAAILLLLAAAVTMWGVRRELRQVRAERAAVHPQVAATLVGRSTVEDAYRRLAALTAAQRSAPRWAPVLAGMSELLPDDAFLTAFRTRGDSVTIDGMAARAARVFDAVHGSELLAGVRAPAPVRREAPDGGDPLERFSLAGTLPSHDTIPVATPVGTAAKPVGTP